MIDPFVLHGRDDSFQVIRDSRQAKLNVLHVFLATSKPILQSRFDLCPKSNYDMSVLNHLRGLELEINEAAIKKEHCNTNGAIKGAALLT